MKTKSVTKRVLSVILCTVMLFSCWVFSMPTAVAQDAGSYDVRVTINVTGTNNIEAAYQGFEGAKGDSAGVTIRCLKDNGVSTTTTDLNWDIGKKGGNQIKTKGNHTLTGTAAGFPAYIYLYLCDNYWFSGVGYSVTKLEVKGTSQSSYTTLWSGTMHVASKTNGYGGWLRYDGHVKGFDHGLKNADEGNTGDSDNYINTGDKKGWLANFPYRSSGGAVSASNITLDGTNSKTSAFTIGDAKDQYSVNYATSNLDSTAMSTPSYNSSYITYSGDSGNPARTITATKNAHIWDDGVNSQNVSVTAYWKTKNTTNTMAKTTTSKTISITDETYTYTWNWKETNTSNLDSPTSKSTTLSPSYGDTPSIPSTATATKAYYTTAKHWSGGSYTTPARASAAKTYTMSYSTNGEAHSYTYSGITNDHTYHKGTCSCGYALSTTFKHTYGAPTITFAANGKTATASRTCTTTGCNHTQTITATVTSVVKTPATCNAKGITTYTATATFTKVNEETELTVTDTKDVDDIPIVDNAHNWTNTKTYLRTPAKCGEDATYWKECSHNTNHKAETLDATQYWTDENTALAHDYSDPTIFAGKETYRGTEYDGATHHKQTCGRDTLCNDGADCNGEYAVKYGVHAWSTWAYTVPEDDGTRVIGIVLDQLDGFDGTKKCYRYCTACGYVELSAEHNITSSVTKAATCTEAGITTYTCTICGYKDIKEGIPAALGHNYVQASVAPVDGGEDITTEKSVKAYEYFYCDRCNESYCPAIYDETSGEYVKDTENAKSTLVEIEENVEEIPTPLFNDHKETYTSGTKTGQYYYDERSSSFKLMTGDDKEYAGANTKQDFRFSGSVQIPVDISYRIGTDGDNVITDFGYVYSQDSYIGSDPSRLVLNSGDAKIASLSVVGNKKTSNPVTKEAQNGGRLIGAGGAWSGVSYFHNDGDTTYELTFNLVISISAKNWKLQYAARPYVKYLYHGVEYTVYDGGATGVGYETYSHSAVFSNVVYGLTAGAESQAVQDYCMSRIIPHHNDFYPATITTKTDANTDWWKKIDIWEGTGLTWDEFSGSYIGEAYDELIAPYSAQS